MALSMIHSNALALHSQNVYQTTNESKLEFKKNSINWKYFYIYFWWTIALALSKDSVLCLCPFGLGRVIRPHSLYRYGRFAFSLTMVRNNSIIIGSAKGLVNTYLYKYIIELVFVCDLAVEDSEIVFLIQLQIYWSVLWSSHIMSLAIWKSYLYIACEMT